MKSRNIERCEDCCEKPEELIGKTGTCNFEAD
jgi:hypothetical protein